MQLLKTEGLRGLIIETFGSGNAPTYQWFLDDLKQYIDKGGIILNVTQCHGGSVEMGLYETSRQMLACGSSKRERYYIRSIRYQTDASAWKIFIEGKSSRIIEYIAGRRNHVTGRYCNNIFVICAPVFKIYMQLY